MKAHLEVQIATYGGAGLQRLVTVAFLPRVEGVRYLVSCQGFMHQRDLDKAVPDELVCRPDIVVQWCAGKGVSLNRNTMLRCLFGERPHDKLTGEAWPVPVAVLFGDDDLKYNGESLRQLREYFVQHTDIDAATCQVKGGGDRVYGLLASAKALARLWWRFKYTPSCTISLRPECLCITTNVERHITAQTSTHAIAQAERPLILFPENMGVGTAYATAGEEDVFMCRLLRKGVKIRPTGLLLGAHLHSTTNERKADVPRLRAITMALKTVYPYTWPLFWIKACLRFRKVLPWRVAKPT